jgi:hypothetical protein
MKTLGKFSLFIVIVLALGCGGKRSHPPEAVRVPEPVEAQEKDGEEEGSLESHCFEGHLEACDELGH